MGAAQIDPHHKQTGERDTKEEVREPNYQKVITLTIVEILAFSVGVGSAINFLFYALPQKDKTQAIIACAAIIIFTTIGVAAHLISRLPPAGPPGPSTDASQPSAQQQLDQRAWLTISNVELTGEPTGTNKIGITCRVSNIGKIPAVEVTSRTSTGTFVPSDPPISVTGWQRLPRSR